jgi:SpoVK/Ycf46/Vps4 family AAA+-type ATPase
MPSTLAEGSLVRASEFCRWPTLEHENKTVRCSAIVATSCRSKQDLVGRRVDDAKVKRPFRPRGTTPVVYAASLDLLQDLGTTAGNLVRLSLELDRSEKRHIVATIELQKPDSEDTDASEMHMTRSGVVSSRLPLLLISLLTAINLGWVPIESEETKEVSVVTVSHSVLCPADRCILSVVGPPVALNAESNVSEPLPPAGTLLQLGTLVQVQSDQGDPYFYEVLDVSTSDPPDDVRADEYWCQSTVHTRFVFEAVQDITVPRLPALNDSKSNFPHPDVPRLVQLWQTYDGSVSNNVSTSRAECILHVMGKDHDHHIALAVECAAEQVGRQCVMISGLAANAYIHSDKTNHKVTTGGLVDKLMGLECALDTAINRAPSVLLLMDMCQELSRHDAGVRTQEESGIWSLLTSKLPSIRAINRASRLPIQVPPVLVVLNTRQPLPPSIWLQNLVFSSVPASLPDESYIDYLWQRHDISVDSVELGSLKRITISPKLSAIPLANVRLLMKGRPAGKILEIRDEVSLKLNSNLADENIDALDLLERICQRHDESRRRNVGSSRIPRTKWEDIGGLAHVRREILDAIELPLIHPQLFSSAAGGRTGMLLYGPPGTGKTLVAKAVATECGLPFISIKGPELLGSYVGESEAQVRSTFQQARELAKDNQPKASILFFDELDSLAPRRGDQAMGGNVMDRVVATLLAELDKDPGDGSFVFCMGATNRPDLLDPALLRPGRLDRLVYLGVSPSDHASILTTQLRKLRLNGDASKMAQALVEHLSPNLTGADLSTIASGGLLRATDRLCKEADRELEQRRKDSPGNDLTIDDVLASWDETKLEPVVTLDDLLYASETIVPSVSAAELENYERLGRHFSMTT